MLTLRVLVGIAVIVLLHGGTVRAGQAAQAPASNDDCTACHGDATLTRSSGSSVAVDVPTFTASQHGALLCVDCHADLAGKSEIPHPEKLARVNCATCHGDVGVTYDDSIHARARRDAGLNVAPTCSGCHGTHDILPRSDPKSRVAHPQVPATCGTCHEGIKTRFDMGVHAAAIQKGNAGAPSCATCHTAHDIQRVDSQATRLSASECGTCHLSVVESYARTFHGKVVQLGSGGVAACADCHSAHEILPKSNPASSIAPQNLQATCGSCHPGANASFVQYDPHPNPNDYNRSAVLWWANRFYWILIPACFGFFGLHGVLWFWRARRESRGKGGHA